MVFEDYANHERIQIQLPNLRAAHFGRNRMERTPNQMSVV
jgi:hypothetical protein